VTEPAVLRGKRVVLRPLRPGDAEDLAAGCADPLTQGNLALPSPYTLQDARHWIEVGAPAANAAGNWAYAFADPDSDRLIGGGGVSRRGHGVAELGCWVAPWARDRGVGTQAVRLLTGHAFDHGVYRLVLRTRLENIAGQRIAIAAGFTREGIARHAGVTGAGNRYDTVVWSRLLGDEDGPSRRLLPDLPPLPGRPDAPGMPGVPGVPGVPAWYGALSDGVVILHPLTAQDAADTHALRSLPEVVNTSVPPVAPDLAEVRRRCAQAPARWLAGERAEFVIRDATTGEYAGEIGLYYFEPPTQQAMIGYSLMPHSRGRGFTTRAVNLVTAWAFEIGIARVVAGTAADNEASQRVLQRAGFEREGYQRARLPGPDGTRIDDIQWVRLAPTIGV